jgi:hypothetical protein
MGLDHSVTGDDVIERYRPLSVQDRGEVYLRIKDALRLLEDARELGLAVLSIEGFEVQGESVSARLDLIAHYSPGSRQETWAEFLASTHGGAELFLSELAHDGALAVVVQLWNLSDWRSHFPLQG